MIKPYIDVTKPGIIFGNLISFTGGFFLAAKGAINWPLFLTSLLGVSFVIASGCVFNNYIDRDIDKIMERTKHRVLVKGLMDPKVSLIYASVLGLSGVFLLLTTNTLTVLLAIMGFVIYVLFYSLYMKRRSVYGTLIGSLSGAVPPVIGYCSVTDRFDVGAFILLLLLALWQMPHSYAIGIFRFKDYQVAKIPVLPVVKGIPVTKNHIIFYIFAFMIATLMLTLMGYTGYLFMMTSIVLNGIWLVMALKGYKASDDSLWAKKIFMFSIIIISLLSVMMSIH